jgi:hypothetical protein
MSTTKAKDCVHVPDIYVTPTGTAAQIDAINAQNDVNARLYRACRFLLRKDFGLEYVPADPKAFLSTGDHPGTMSGLKDLEDQVHKYASKVTEGEKALVAMAAKITDQEQKVSDLMNRQALGGDSNGLVSAQNKLQELSDQNDEMSAAHDDVQNQYAEAAAALDAKKNAFTFDHIRFLAVYGLMKADNWDPAGGRTQPGPDDQRLPMGGGRYEIVSRPFADALVGAVREYTAAADLYRRTYDFLKTQSQPS